MERLLYGTLGVAALIGTQTALVWHFASGGDVQTFVTDTVSTPAGVFAVVDLLVVAAAALTFMLLEGRRLGMRHLWVYVVLTFTVAISVAFPAFLLARSRHLRWSA